MSQVTRAGCPTFCADRCEDSHCDVPWQDPQPTGALAVAEAGEGLLSRCRAMY